MKHWTRDTLDSVVEHGTSLYDKIGKYEFLAVENLPSVVEIFNEPINVEFKFNSHGILRREKGSMDILKDMIRRNVEVTGNTCDSGFLLWRFENCVSVMVKKQLTHVEFVLLDSYARDEEGRVSSNVVSVLLFFKGVSSLVNYLCNTYLGDCSDKLTGYQIQFVNCSGTMSKEKQKKIVRRHKSRLYLTFSNQIRREKYEEKVRRLDACEKAKINKQHQKEKETQEQREKKVEKLKEYDRLRRINESLELRSLRIARVKRNQKVKLKNQTSVEKNFRVARLRANVRRRKGSMRLPLKEIVDLQEKEQMRRRKGSMRLPLKEIVDLQD